MRVPRHAPTGVAPNGGLISVRRHAPTGVTPRRRSHACIVAPKRRSHARTEACPDRGTTLTEFFMLVRRHAPTGVAPKRRFSCVYGGVLQQG